MMIGISSSPFPCCRATYRCHSEATGARLQSPLSLLRLGQRSKRRHITLRCQNCGGNPASPSGDNDSKAVLDAFFLGRAFAESLNERVGFAVGEVLSVFGQWQAEQQKQVQDFQEEVIEMAKKAKEKAALEAMEEQGSTSKSFTKPPVSYTPGSFPSTGPTNEDPLDEILKE
ncbi:hypothetical protein KSP40_PGU004848 [Platanthera guangdongensis]|uniref:Uncharacterized protein n=1 Tax=Platanthera guangdongensis TaxID=2320717 RepID=A0ABR2MUT1_9ASPA